MAALVIFPASLPFSLPSLSLALSLLPITKKDPVYFSPILPLNVQTCFVWDETDGDNNNRFHAINVLSLDLHGYVIDC